MKILIADKFEKVGLDKLKALGCKVEVQPDLGAERLPDAMTGFDPDVLIVRSTKVKADAIKAGKRLSLIIRAGAGFDTIDVPAASNSGVFVANCPGKNSIAVAELAFALLLACDRRVPDQTEELRAGKWNKKEYSKARGLYGRTLGIVGLGRIAEEVTERARAFGMKVCAWSRSLTPERASELGVTYCSSILEVAKQSDAVSVHVASTPETRGLVGAEFFAALKPGAYFVNTARGEVVDEAALRRAIAEKGVRAGLDVFEGEPAGGTAAFASPIARDPGVYGSHHVGASTDQAQDAIANETVRIVQRYLETGDVRNCVNRAEKSAAKRLLTVRHRNRPGVLASVFQVLSDAKINVEEMENILYQGAEAACARIRLDAEPTPAQLERMRAACEHIISLDLATI